VCKNSPLDFISNEKIKRDVQETSFVLHGSEAFSREHQKSDEEDVTKKMLEEFAAITGGWAISPEWKELHFWRYSRAQKVINSPYLELEDEDAPMALVGDYLNDNTVDAAYRSGYLLANDWAKKF
jgi:predicted NAD/FAD-dependent oxidoreductase